MKPEERSSSQNGTSLPGQGQSVSEPTNHADQPSQEAAAQVIRSQIDSLYENKKDQPATPVEPELTPAPLEDVNPYQRTHSEKPNLQANDWSHYHSAWQNYYQKYYEGYYLHHLNTNWCQYQNCRISNRLCLTRC